MGEQNFCLTCTYNPRLCTGQPCGNGIFKAYRLAVEQSKLVMVCVSCAYWCRKQSQELLHMHSDKLLNNPGKYHNNDHEKRPPKTLS